MSQIITVRPEKSVFDSMAKRVEGWMGQPMAFVIALALCVVWAFTGPVFGFSNTWQLIINTATTLVTFLMVFLIQSATNRSGAAIQLKLDELIRANQHASNAVLTIENLTLEELEHIKTRYEDLAQAARARLREGAARVVGP